jgi:hypothetical protein
MSEGLRTRYLGLLQDKFNNIARHIEAIHVKVDAKNPASIATAASELKVVIRDLEELQTFQRSLPDTQEASTSVGGEVTRSIGTEISDLLQQVKSLLAQLEVIGERFRERTAGAAAAAFQSSTNSLTRAEVARLLLLISKAYSIRYITPEQKR